MEIRRWWIYSSISKPLPLILIDCHSELDFDRKSSSAQFEENGRGWRTELNLGCKDDLSESVTASVIQGLCKSLKIICCQHWSPRDTNIFHVLHIDVGRGQRYRVLISVFRLEQFLGGKKLIKIKEISTNTEI
jgi:hypothetical protein